MSQPSITESKQETLRSELKQLRNTYEDLVVLVENLGLTQKQYEKMEKVTLALYSFIVELEEEVN